jgi:hypothetical protein
MTTHHDLIDLERSAWDALATSGEAAATFYEERLSRHPLVLLPGGMSIDDRDAIIDSMRGAPWDRFELSDERVIDLTDDAAVVAYRATAVRGDHEYTALFNSTYVHEDGEWRMALHQQTPV